MSKEDKKHIKKLEAYKLEAKAREKYALDRFDILIISLSSGGLVLSLGILEKFLIVDKSLVNLAWLFFSCALISNLLSQITGYKANKVDIKCTQMCIDETKGLHPRDTHIKIDKIKERFNKFTSALNIISFLSLSAGIILLIIFVNIKVY